MSTTRTTTTRTTTTTPDTTPVARKTPSTKKAAPATDTKAILEARAVELIGQRAKLDASDARARKTIESNAEARQNIDDELNDIPAQYLPDNAPDTRPDPTRKDRPTLFTRRATRTESDPATSANKHWWIRSVIFMVVGGLIGLIVALIVLTIFGLLNPSASPLFQSLLGLLAVLLIVGGAALGFYKSTTPRQFKQEVRNDPNH